jgi:hypothetical protein
MPAGIQIIRTDFARLDAQTAFFQQTQQAQRYRGFTTAASGTCKNKRAKIGRHTLILFRVVGV